MTYLPRITLWLSGLGFLGFGLACLIAPLAVLGAVDVVVSGPIAATEIRAFYGGLEIGLGALLIAAALQPAQQRPGLWLGFAAYGGIGFARLAGILIDSASSTFLWAALATELGLAGLAAVCLLRGSKSP